MRFETQLGYWVNEPLFQFQTREVIDAKKLRADLLTSYKMLDRSLNGWQSSQKELNLCVESLKSLEQLSKEQQEQIKLWTGYTEKERKRRIRARRYFTVAIIGSFLGGAYLGSK